VTSFPVAWLPRSASYSLVGSQTHQTPLFGPLQPNAGWLLVKWRHFRVTCGHMGLRDVISCDVTSSSCEQQPCRQSNAPKMRLFGPLQPTAGDFRSNHVTAGPFPVPGHAMSFNVTWWPPPASYSFVGSQMHQKRQFSALYSQFQVTFGKMTSLPGHFRAPEVMWCHFLWRDFLLPASNSLVGSQMHKRCDFSALYSHLQVTSGQMALLLGLFQSPEVMWCHWTSRDCLLLWATALQKVKRTKDASLQPFKPLLGDFRWNDVTSVSLQGTWSCDIISCHVTASSCELQPCRQSNTTKMPVFGFLQPLPGDFRSNDTSVSLPVTLGHVTSFPLTSLPPPTSYSLVGSQMHQRRQVLALYSQFQATSCEMTSLLGHFQAPEITWHHLLSRDFLLQFTAL